jgi:glycine oxidase
VEIVDDRPAGMGATQAAAGVLAPFIEARRGGPLLDLTACSLDLYDDFVRRVSADSGVAVNYRRSGTLDVAFDDDELAGLSAAAEALAKRNVEAELLDAQAVRAREPHVSERARGGLFIPTHGYVAPSDLIRALTAGARRHGAQLIEHGRVHKVSRPADELIVHTDRGSLAGDAVVIAAGSWAAHIEIEGTPARVPVKPIRGQLLQLAWAGSSLAHVLWSAGCYMVPWQDGTVLVGATVEDTGFDERATVSGVRGLLAAASEFVPQTASAGFTSARVGLRPLAPDELPIIGLSQVLPNLVYATGHFRNGILLAPLTARLVADALLNGHHDGMLDSTAPQRFGAL